MRVAMIWILAGIWGLAACGTPATLPPGTDTPESTQADVIPPPIVPIPPSPTRQPTALPTEAAGMGKDISPVDTPSPESAGSSPQTKSDGRQAVFPNTIIVYRREDRSLNNRRQWTIYRTGRIVADDGTEWQAGAGEVGRLFDMVESPDVWNLADGYSALPDCPDCIVHIVTVYRQGEVKKLIFSQGAPPLPGDLSRIVDEIKRLIK